MFTCDIKLWVYWTADTFRMLTCVDTKNRVEFDGGSTSPFPLLSLPSSLLMDHLPRFTRRRRKQPWTLSVSAGKTTWFGIKNNVHVFYSRKRPYPHRGTDRLQLQWLSTLSSSGKHERILWNLIVLYLVYTNGKYKISFFAH